MHHNKYVGAPWYKRDSTRKDFKVAENQMNNIFVNNMFKKTAFAIKGQLQAFVVLVPVSKTSQTVVKKRT